MLTYQPGSWLLSILQTVGSAPQNYARKKSFGKSVVGPSKQIKLPVCHHLLHQSFLPFRHLFILSVRHSWITHCSIVRQWQRRHTFTVTTHHHYDGGLTSTARTTMARLTATKCHRLQIIVTLTSRLRVQWFMGI